MIELPRFHVDATNTDEKPTRRRREERGMEGARGTGHTHDVRFHVVRRRRRTGMGSESDALGREGERDRERAFFQRHVRRGPAGSDMPGVASNAVQRPTNQQLGARYGGAVPRPVSLVGLDGAGKLASRAAVPRQASKHSTWRITCVRVRLAVAVTGTAQARARRESASRQSFSSPLL
jgi:hypothetical protein